MLAAVVGLLLNHRWREGYSFAIYVATVLVTQLLQVLWPGHFYTYDFWVFKEVLHAALKFAIVLELGYRILAAFPGALATGRRLALLLVGVVYAVIVGVPGGSGAEFVARVLPRVLNGTIWLFVALASIVLWYRLPIRPLHKAILLGFVPYLLVFSVAMSALDTFGWSVLPRIGYLHSVSYLLLLTYWVYAIWRSRTERA